MAPHSSTLAWKIPWMEEPGMLQSMGSLRVGHDWLTSLSLFTFMHWRRKWQPTPEFLPGGTRILPQGRGSLVSCHLWGRTVGHDWSDLAAAAAAYFLLHLDSLFPSRTCWACSMGESLISIGSKHAKLRCRMTSKETVFYSFISDRETTDD